MHFVIHRHISRLQGALCIPKAELLKLRLERGIEEEFVGRLSAKRPSELYIRSEKILKKGKHRYWSVVSNGKAASRLEKRQKTGTLATKDSSSGSNKSGL